jgi:hypothetical protein
MDVKGRLLALAVGDDDPSLGTLPPEVRLGGESSLRCRDERNVAAQRMADSGWTCSPRRVLRD